MGKERECLILEDDFEWNTGAAAAMSRPLAASDNSRTIYMNTFNHMLFPALRIAYIIVPTALIDRFAAVQYGLHGSSNVPNQMVMADFIDRGHLDEHLKRLKASREERRDALAQNLESQLSDYVSVTDSQAGTHTICAIRRCAMGDLLTACRAQGVAVEDMSIFRLSAKTMDQIILGYSGFTPGAITAACAKLRDAFKSIKPASCATKDSGSLVAGSAGQKS